MIASYTHAELDSDGNPMPPSDVVVRALRADGTVVKQFPGPVRNPGTDAEDQCILTPAEAAQVASFDFQTRSTRGPSDLLLVPLPPEGAKGTRSGPPTNASVRNA